MFRDQSGNLCANAEKIAERISTLPADEVNALQERKNILRDALNEFDLTLRGISQRERDAALSLFYKEITDRLFDFQLSLITRNSRERIVYARTREEKAEALRDFQATLEKLGRLYGV